MVMIPTFDESAQLVFEWAQQKNLIVKGNEFNQIKKVREEVLEIVDAIQSQNIDKIRDEIGDGFVTLIILARQVGLSPEECLNEAYNKISKRKGKTINGIFVKD
jgi:NTP pyrophosphatase (non-canonical NTP hydrolase)